MLAVVIDAGTQRSAASLKAAIRTGQAKVLDMLLQRGAEAKSFDVLRLEVEYKRSLMVEALLKAGADPNQLGEWNFTPLKEAANGDAVDITNMLIRHGAELEGRSAQEAIQPVIQRQHNDVNSALLLGGANVNSIGVLQSTIKESKNELIKLTSAADVNGKDQDSQTPLVVALSAGVMDIAKELLNKGPWP